MLKLRDGGDNDDNDIFDFGNNDFLQNIFDTKKTHKATEIVRQLPKTSSSYIQEISTFPISKPSSPELTPVQPHKVVHNNNKRPSPTSPLRHNQQYNIKKRLIDSVKDSCQKLPHRKIPGPAGSFSSIELDHLTEETRSPHIIKNKSSKRASIIKESPSNLENESWKDMMCECDLFKEISSEFNISSIITRVSVNLLPKGKVPLLIVQLKSVLQKSYEASSVIFEDSTGEIQATIFWDKANTTFENLQPSSVLLLNQVTVFPLSSNRFYLSVMHNSIICVWQNKERISLFSKPQLSAKIILWLKQCGVSKNYCAAEFRKNNSVDKIGSGSQASGTLNNMQGNQLTHNIVPTSSKNLPEDEDILWKDDEFDQILQDDLSEFLKDDEDDEMLAKFEF